MASLIVDPEGSAPAPVSTDTDSALVNWVMSRVDRWRAARDANFRDRWDEYYRMWRGRWNSRDKNRDSERSRLIAPALAQAIEMTVSEMEEATFGREQWFDVTDDLKDRPAAIEGRDQLLTDLYRMNIPDKIAEVYMNGALYGSGIGKITVNPSEDKAIGPDGNITSQPRVYIGLEPIPADEFVPDPAGRTVDEMLGCAHEVIKPRHYVDQMQGKGLWKKGINVGGLTRNDDRSTARADLEQPVTSTDAVLVTEYHGLVPAKYLPTKKPAAAAAPVDALLDGASAKEDGDGPLVESIVAILNGSVCASAVANPFTMGDRSIIAYQHDKVPGRFWGRGVAEKGYNPQKALDAELRSRIDALGLISNPMMGADVTRLPRGFDLRVRPGKVWATQGAPKDILQPVTFAGLEPATFNQTGDMERMVQMGTGAMDTATPASQSNRNETATGANLMVGAFIKRSKRAMNQVSRNFLEPFVQKALWRYRQFEPSRYPQSFTFRVIATSGIMAREFEQNQLTQLMGQLPDTMQAPKLLLLKAIIEQSSTTVKKEIQDGIDAALKPNPEQQQRQKMMEQMQFEAAQLDLANKRLQNSLLASTAALNIAKAGTEEAKSGDMDSKNALHGAELLLQANEQDLLAEQNHISGAKVVVEAVKAKAAVIKARQPAKGN